MVRSLKFRMITAISTGRTLAATPRDGRSVSNLNRPPATIQGAPGQRPPAPQSYGPQGAQEKWAPYQSSSGRLLSPCLLTVRAPQPGSTRPRLPGGRPTSLRPASPLGTPICPSHLGAGPRTASAPGVARRTSQDRCRSPPAGPRARSPPGHTNSQGATPGATAPRQWPHLQSPLTSSFAPSQRHLNSARGGPARQLGRSRSAAPIGPGNPGAHHTILCLCLDMC
ncbi:hypothetical protein NDU88_002643 [Pleurodeles waltl]|uniref:Uncharacterized protein n=1 Tax=Pleurodeles waltl TaxID=8319 RepID=A0AAV7T3V3_PLEWA|nr:hypothetical protein NDU88_002643 [Pleurodeles waltl]